jgi:crotonobetainyl-CoA:carnitine CoA-transferase CaiB-like acyl-CoA transferase
MIDPAALAGLRILDLSRVLAGPSATQILGDLGADVVKVERPGHGDDTRAWGPPYLKDADGEDTAESAYYLSANRNKRSLALDFTTERGRALLLKLIARADVLVENFKAGTLASHSLGYDDLKSQHPRLIYCSITGFGQTGPYAGRPGYDYMIQGMGGIMAITGEPEGEPMKVGVAIADLMAGMYAAVGILAALRHRDATGEGQFVDISLLDTQVAWLSNAGQYVLTSGAPPPRHGNAHPMIVPYQAFKACDRHFILAVGNDAQFRRLCGLIGRPELADDPRFATNAARVRHRAELVELLAAPLEARPAADWLTDCEAHGIPAGPINGLDQVFADPQVQARGMTVALPHPLAPDPVALIASPLKLSATPPAYRRAPPTLGQHTDAVLRDWLGLEAEEIARLGADGTVQRCP